MAACMHIMCRKEENCQYDPKYGTRWYLYKDGRPPENDNSDYTWNGFQWVRDEEAGPNLKIK